MKILNLYAGIGGNRKLWGNDYEITAVEINPEIAKVYQDHFPNDKVIVGDAHQYLLDHYKEYDFIWASPPCQSHSRLRYVGTLKGKNSIIYPDMTLYQEIIFLQKYAQCSWVVENVISYYPFLIKPKICHRHAFWSNFPIRKINLKPDKIEYGTKEYREKNLGFNLSEVKFKSARKDQTLKNTMNPKLGKHIFDCAFKEKQLFLTEDGNSKK